MTFGYLEIEWVLGQYILYNTKIENPQVSSFIKDKIIIFAAKFIYKRNEINSTLNKGRQLFYFL